MADNNTPLLHVDVGMQLSLAVVVKDVSDRSIAARSGIRVGDQIQEVGAWCCHA